MEEEETTIIIPAITPGFVDRGLLWWSDHREQVLQAVRDLPWWSQHVVVVDIGDENNQSPFVRRLMDMGYERVQRLAEPGQVAVRGGIVDIYPIGMENAVRMEWEGKRVADVQILTDGMIEREASRAARRRADATFLRMLRDGDYVVHADHGIGIFRERITAAPREGKEPKPYVVLEYAQNDRLSVPEHIAAEKLTPYAGFRKPTIHRLGGTVWFKAKRAARKDAERFARKLLVLYAKREQAQGFAYPEDDALERAVAASFPHRETPDQTRTIKEVFRTMERPRPMDRLVCADVGFGKTEVAVRASVKAAHAGKQTAILVPTTILAYQHDKTFRERLAAFPFRIAMLSRLCSRDEERAVLREMESGEVDIVIGTHRLLSDDITFNNLGLVIIDEEQRFGVRHKERLRAMRVSVDVLSLSATPIPRTLHMALSGLRDISIMTTPPPTRVPVETETGVLRRSTVLEALRREHARGGQSYVLHNRIGTIEKEAQRLRANLTDVVVEVAHGRLPEEELVRVIQRFAEGAIDVLVATTIIENGLDFSHVNTLVVEDASHLGLAQAHQIRGRVGRGDRKAYAYFLVPKNKMKERVKQRLRILEQAVELGAGFEIAQRDLAMRGAGNILGREQSGTAYAVGLNLYSQMLAEAIEGIKSQ